MILLQPTSQKCPDCGHNLDRAEGLKACLHCGAGPLCPVCLDAHTRSPHEPPPKDKTTRMSVESFMDAKRLIEMNGGWGPHPPWEEDDACDKLAERNNA